MQWNEEKFFKHERNDPTETTFHADTFYDKRYDYSTLPKQVKERL